MSKNFTAIYLRDTQEHITVYDQELASLLEEGYVVKSKSKNAEYGLAKNKDSEDVATYLVAKHESVKPEATKPVKRSNP